MIVFALFMALLGITLDAVTTVIVVASGFGHEANPVLAVAVKHFGLKLGVVVSHALIGAGVLYLGMRGALLPIAVLGGAFWLASLSNLSILLGHW